MNFMLSLLVCNVSCKNKNKQQQLKYKNKEQQLKYNKMTHEKWKIKLNFYIVNN